MSSTFAWVASSAILAALVNAVGIFVVFRHRRGAEKFMSYLLCFAAGLLISTPLMIALPEAIAKSPHAGVMALGGFLFMFFSSRAARHFAHEEALAFGITAAQGIAIHSFVDGVVYAVTFEASVLIGIMSAGGLIVHEFAEGVITYLVLMKGNIHKRTAMVYAFIIASLTTPLGAFAAYPFVRSIGNNALGMMLGFVSGVLVYVSASHLLPEARAHEKRHSLLAFISGVAIALVIAFSHSH